MVVSLNSRLESNKEEAETWGEERTDDEVEIRGGEVVLGHVRQHEARACVRRWPRPQALRAPSLLQCFYIHTNIWLDIMYICQD